MVAACGGGEGGNASPSPAPVPTPPPPSTANPRSPVGFTPSVDPATITTTATTRSDGYRQAEGFIAFGSGCSAAQTSHAVVETANVLVYADAASTRATQAHRETTARWADAAVQTVRQRFGLSATVGLNGSRVRLCLAPGDGGAAGFNSTQISDALVVDTDPENSSSLQAVLMHEMVHVAQQQALGCSSGSYFHERWFLEGMALRLAGQDVPYANELASYRAAIYPGNATPFDVVGATSGSLDHYMGFRMAIDVLLHQSGKTERDLYTFVAQVGAASGCPTGTNNGAGWKPAFDAFFGLPLRGAGPLGDGFWAIAPQYTQP